MAKLLNMFPRIPGLSSKEGERAHIKPTNRTEGKKEEQDLKNSIFLSGIPVEYIFIDHDRLKSYTEQIAGPSLKEKVPSWSVDISLSGPKVVGKTASHTRPRTNHEMIKLLLAHLEKEGELSNDSPNPTFALERMKAKKVIIRLDESSVLPNLEQISVWVSEPDPEVLRQPYDPWDPQGIFLYLIEAYWGSDNSNTFGMISGFSALRMLLSDFYTSERIEDEVGKISKYGKTHPIDVLEKFGGFVMPEREIFSLYRVRYASDDQFFEDDRGPHRSYDILGYPIFVAEYRSNMKNDTD